LITIAVPPALPAAMSCGMIFAINRLKKRNIFCISPPRINVAGHIETFVFDKTGTLTEEGLSVLGFRAATTTKFPKGGNKEKSCVIF
jgi:cation-transporting ATPase 13A3/4/5